LAWLCAKAYRAAAEAAADEAVLLAGVRPTDYASVLLSLVSELKDQRQPDLVFGASVLSRNGIEDRIRAIVSIRPRQASTHRAGLFISILALLLVVGTGSVQVAAAAPQEKEAVPDIFNGKSKEWMDGYLSAQSYVKENGTPGPMRSDQEKYDIEKRAAYELEKRLNGG
jgi:hypothetical protein